MLKRLEDEVAESQELQDEEIVDGEHQDENLAEEQPDENAAPWIDADTQAFLVSLMFHVVVILGLAVVPMVADQLPSSVFLSAVTPLEAEEEFTLIEEVAVSDETSTEIGANSHSDSAMALSMAPVLADLSEIAAPSFDPPSVNATYDLNNQLQQAVGLVRNNTIVKGMTGVGTTGTDGAVDRITYELLKSMEERPTLVVWLFDQSGSLQRRRQEIRDRFDRIYEELGILSASKQEDGKLKPDAQQPLLTSVIAFGNEVSLLTKNPTADIDEIRSVIDSIEMDTTGVEKVFHAIFLAVDKYKSFRTSRGGRNVILVAVTDERGDDAEGLDATIKECRKYAIPVYVIGVPAPFGRDVTLVKYVDPDPQFDQSPQWAQVDQGPESLMPERVKLGYKENYYEEPVIDSGFGPYALSRLTYETGGIYFTVHPNRQFNRRVTRNEIDPFASEMAYFFDPEVMVKYRPDYESMDQYMKKVQASPLRQVVVRAAQMARVGSLDKPTLRFVRRDEAALVNDLTAAQQQAAKLEPQLASLLQVLQAGVDHRDKEASPRWLAGFDLALGTVMAHKVRAEGYNAMLAKAKRGMVFQDAKNNTWQLVPDKEISVGSKLEKEGNEAVRLLTEVAENHKGTPWGLLASRELQNPVGWKWVEEFTDLNPPPRMNNQPANNNVVTPGQDDKAKILAPPPPQRPIPKL
jgi:hypothetical protein